MPFRFRRSLRFGPFRLNFTANGLSSLSIGRPGATVNVPIARSGPATATVGIPGTGLSWSESLGARPSSSQRRQQQRGDAGLPTTEQLIQQVLAGFVGFDRVGDALWRQGLIERVLEHDDTPRRVREAALLVRSVEAVELHMRRARGPAATARAGQEVIAAAQLVLAWTEAQGWSCPAD